MGRDECKRERNRVAIVASRVEGSSSRLADFKSRIALIIAALALQHWFSASPISPSGPLYRSSVGCIFYSIAEARPLGFNPRLARKELSVDLGHRYVKYGMADKMIVPVTP